MPGKCHISRIISASKMFATEKENRINIAYAILQCLNRMELFAVIIERLFNLLPTDEVLRLRHP